MRERKKREREREEKVIFKACTYTSEIVISNNYKNVYIYHNTSLESLDIFSASWYISIEA